MKFFKYVFVLCILTKSITTAAQSASDSTKVASTLANLFEICKKVDFGDPKVQQLGTFYRAAPYIIYMGADKARKWKTIADYTKVEDKKGVDEVCFKINSTVNQDSNYRFIKYFTEKESEGNWHVMIVSYVRKGAAKTAAFTFLKINDNFALGDID